MPITIERTQTLVSTTCWKCGVMFAIPKPLYLKLQEDPTREVFCPNGHGGVLASSRADKLAEENARLQRELTARIAAQDQAEAHAQELAKAVRTSQAQLKRVQQRVGNGVCPCCNRHFTNLERHMHGQHPDWRDAEARGNTPVATRMQVCSYCKGEYKGLAIHISLAHRR